MHLLHISKRTVGSYDQSKWLLGIWVVHVEQTEIGSRPQVILCWGQGTHDKGPVPSFCCLDCVIVFSIQPVLVHWRDAIAQLCQKKYLTCRNISSKILQELIFIQKKTLVIEIRKYCILKNSNELDLKKSKNVKAVGCLKVHLIRKKNLNKSILKQSLSLFLSTGVPWTP